MIRFDEVVIDCTDPRALASFWAAATGYQVANVSDTWASIVGESERDICIAFQRVPEPKVGKNRAHVDLAAADEEDELRMIGRPGASRLCTSDKAYGSFVVLVDPEGNEFWVTRLRD